MKKLLLLGVAVYGTIALSSFKEKEVANEEVLLEEVYKPRTGHMACFYTDNFGNLQSGLNCIEDAWGGCGEPYLCGEGKSNM